MVPNRVRALGRRLAVGVTAGVAVLAVTAVPAYASTDYLSDTGPQGWASTVVTWPASSFQVSYHLAVNDTVNDDWCAEGQVKFYAYNGSQLWGLGSFTDCSANGVAGTQSASPNYYPYEVYAVTLELCQRHAYSGAVSCRPKKYAYR